MILFSGWNIECPRRGFPHRSCATSADALVTYFSPRGAMWRNHRPDRLCAPSSCSENPLSTPRCQNALKYPAGVYNAPWKRSSIFLTSEPGACSSSTDANKGNGLICVNVCAWDKDTAHKRALLSHSNLLGVISTQKQAAFPKKPHYLTLCASFLFGTFSLRQDQTPHVNLTFF